MKRTITVAFAAQIIVAIAMIILDLFVIVAIFACLERDRMEDVIILTGTLLAQTPILVLLVKTKF